MQRRVEPQESPCLECSCLPLSFWIPESPLPGFIRSAVWLYSEPKPQGGWFWFPHLQAGFLRAQVGAGSIQSPDHVTYSLGVSKGSCPTLLGTASISVFLMRSLLSQRPPMCLSWGEAGPTWRRHKHTPFLPGGESSTTASPGSPGSPLCPFPCCPQGGRMT